MAWADLSSNECPTQGDIVDLLKTGRTTNMINLYGGFFIGNTGRISIFGAYNSGWHYFLIGMYFKPDNQNINSGFTLSSTMLGNWCSPSSLRDCVSASVFCNNDTQDNTAICFELSGGTIYKRKNGGKAGYAYGSTYFSTVLMTYC